ncbi:hypothetical protein [Dyadobacter sp. 3J3]|uniref:hypothetical protein n=1 Tax=Dyadobacter sp. 3J3 TaxID=2606600 RepID=UPI0013590E07|nr:hypothetical protein [Dyadobacter sp. 3J3]
MDKSIHKKLTERHNELIKLGKVMVAVKESTYTYKTYERAIKGGDEVRADTLEHILTAQSKVIETTKSKLLAL